MSDDALNRLLEIDPHLHPYETVLKRRLEHIQRTERLLVQGKTGICDFAAGYEYFGLHYCGDEWVFREWAPHARAIFLIGEMTRWREDNRFSLERVDNEGVWQINLPASVLTHGDLYRLRVHWLSGSGDRIPSYARRVVQDPHTLIFNAQVWQPPSPYQWKTCDFQRRKGPLFIYEAHVGMAQDAQRVGSFQEFSEKIIPRIVDAGYNTLQLMAIQEHPYYGSFGYQVSNFFAVSSRFGTPDAFKELIDAAHDAGLSVLMDLVHSHAVSNEVEGLSRFDGTTHQYFMSGSRGIHQAWDSRCFDYGKTKVIHFLLSNCRFWLEEYRLDGFRFDGVTSMLYVHHGLGRAFTSYDEYFNEAVDENALAYLALANKLIHALRPDSLTIAEDVSGMPGLAAPPSVGGIGFDYRFAMGISDYWIRLVKDHKDEDWHMGELWHELTNRRKEEKTISYAESHDQALVGDQTLIFRLISSEIYTCMRLQDDCLAVSRGIALHKMIRFITLATAGSGYLNFMGNEFGHPEWIDFPRPGNDWSYTHARRQWHLLDDPNLKYRQLARFDRDMLDLAKRFRLLESSDPRFIYDHNEDKVLAFERGGLLFIFNFHPTRSYYDYRIEAPPGKYRMIFHCDSPEYGGHNRLIPHQHHFTLPENHRHFLSLYLPTRVAVALVPEESRSYADGQPVSKRIRYRKRG